jgi:hypothetical protein
VKPGQWWPPIGVAAMILLGLVVGHGATPLDDWFLHFRHTPVRWLAYFAYPLSLLVIGCIVVGVAAYRRWWRFAAAGIVLPPSAYLLVQLIKPFFGRTKGGGLAYPSGHITMTTVVIGLVVIVAGGALWSVLVAAAYIALAMVGVGSTFHYFTDTIGGLLLGSSVVCIAAYAARRDLTPVNPSAI